MKAISFYNSLPIEDPESLVDVSVEAPKPRSRDLLVEVRAISVNPVDAKIRAGGGPGKAGGQLPILGWDAAGVVTEIGAEVALFKPGDEVYYAGSVDRAGSYAEFQCVDERIVGRKPRTLGFAEAAALPLTTITAWEMLFDRLHLDKSTEGSLLIVGGAGGVGSIATQLAKQVKGIVPGGVNYVLALTKTEDHFDELIEAMAPQSAMALIENPARPLDVVKLKPKSISLHWEFMFTRSRYETPDMGEQGHLLNEVASHVDADRIQTTMQANLGTINAANLKRARALVESGKTIGKIVLFGF